MNARTTTRRRRRRWRRTKDKDNGSGKEGAKAKEGKKFMRLVDGMKSDGDQEDNVVTGSLLPSSSSPSQC